MSTFNQNNQKVYGNQYNVGGDLIVNPEVSRILDNLILEVKKSTENGNIPNAVATKMQTQIQDVVAEIKKPECNKMTILEKLNGAKSLIEGVASASGLIKILVETADFLQKTLP